jgi:hypothetical protein
MSGIFGQSVSSRELTTKKSMGKTIRHFSSIAVNFLLVNLTFEEIFVVEQIMNVISVDYSTRGLSNSPKCRVSRTEYNCFIRSL